ncbi:MAG: signal peptide peptidase SppA [Chloroflexi bacterium]|nr:signal peptide peptidase SppA [Chloroflexota bacterium]
MSKNNDQSNFFRELKDELRQLWRTTQDEWHHLWADGRNKIRQLQGAKLDYVIIPLGGPMPERNEPPRSFIERQLPLPTPPMSLERLNGRLRKIADAENVKGVLFILRGFSCGTATLQNIRQAILRLRQAGKEVVVYTPYLNTRHYFVASAAGRIIAPPSARFDVLGLRMEAMFLKDALKQIGVQADVMQISPYKTAGNMFSEADITPEQREQMTWLLDDMFDTLTAAMADGRQQTQAEFQALIDDAPLTIRETLDAGLIDAIAYEDELAYLLAEESEETAESAEDAENGEEETGSRGIPAAQERGLESSATNEEAADDEPPLGDLANRPAEDKRPKASLKEWRDAHNVLLEIPRRHTKKFVGVISLEGAITMGASQKPPVDLPVPLVGGATAGEATLLSLIRRAEGMSNMAALVFHVDSPGGVALAGDLIGREIERLSQKLPVVVYMGNVAASGGYYVSAYGRHIMCQPVTITGSIGVIMMRLSTQGLYQKLHINQASVQRGRHAGLYSDPAPMSDEEREIFRKGIEDVYGQFKQVVADGRDLPYDDLDAICEGRVWTGRQALQRQLVDGYGDFVDAIRQAAELAELPTDDAHEISVVNLYAKGSRHRPAKPFEAADELVKLLTGQHIRQFSGQPLTLLPYEVKIL